MNSSFLQLPNAASATSLNLPHVGNARIIPNRRACNQARRFRPHALTFPICIFSSRLRLPAVFAARSGRQGNPIPCRRTPLGLRLCAASLRKVRQTAAARRLSSYIGPSCICSFVNIIGSHPAKANTSTPSHRPNLIWQEYNEARNPDLQNRKMQSTPLCCRHLDFRRWQTCRQTSTRTEWRPSNTLATQTDA